MKLQQSFIATLLATALIAAAVPAQARSTFCCTDEKGRKHCSDRLPEACYGRAYREINERGMTIQTVDAPLTAAQRAKIDADKQKSTKDAQKNLDQERQDRALLDTFASEADIDYMLGRSTADLKAARDRAKSKLDEATKKRALIKNPPTPEQLSTADMLDNEIRVQSATIKQKEADIAEITAKYEAERLRYRELKGLPPAATKAQ